MQPAQAFSTSSRAEPRSHLLMGAAAGVIAALVALAVGELVAAIIGRSASPIVVVGGTFIDATPEWLKSFAIATFGDRDKDALLLGIGGTLLVAAGILGIIATRWRIIGWLGVAALGLVGAAAAMTRPAGAPIDVLPSVIGAAAGLVALTLLLPPASALSAVQDDGTRRRFLLASGGFLTAVAVASVAARAVAPAATDSALLAVPVPDQPAGPLPAGVERGIADQTPFITPAGSFYRVDTALVVPTVDVATWRLRVHGMVDRELVLTMAELLSRPTIERVITLSCVSNTIGGKYVGNATWVGVPLRGLLAEAGVQAGADQLVSRSVDGMTIGTPTTAVMDGRDAMIAVAMNGEPLPPIHGYPARMLVPGLFGYVSATKWLTELELTTFDAYDAYWVQRGWAQEAPVVTMSRIDTPRPLSRVAPGRIMVAGIAWAQHRGIDAVEVRVDGAEWQAAQLAAVPSLDTWRQWSLAWDATPGSHRLEVRATDGTGTVQTEARAEPFPSGATGWHSTVFTVAEA
jgi:DMSO/TMAO reductase YedYZ molybdopterin-dependent catalytic subunit